MGSGVKKERGTILLVDDDLKVLASLSTLLESFGYKTIKTPDGQEALTLVENPSIELVLLDLVMPSVAGMTILKQILEKTPSLPVIILSGHGTIAKAVEATKIGAFIFLEKPVETEKIMITIENALAKYRLQKEKKTLLEQALDRYKMVGISSATKEIFNLIDRTAATDSKVLITGESGTGREAGSQSYSS